jgi:hypothetical protein
MGIANPFRLLALAIDRRNIQAIRAHAARKTRGSVRAGLMRGKDGKIWTGQFRSRKPEKYTA